MLCYKRFSPGLVVGWGAKRLQQTQGESRPFPRRLRYVSVATTAAAAVERRQGAPMINPVKQTHHRQPWFTVPPHRTKKHASCMTKLEQADLQLELVRICEEVSGGPVDQDVHPPVRLHRECYRGFGAFS